MKGMGLINCQLKTHKYKQADQEHKTHDNILDRNFSPEAPNGVLFHSDQGTHYTSQEFAESVASCNGMVQSMSRKGNCWDNAPTERFFRSFKTEWMLKGGYEDIAEASSAITDYIWGYYQAVRPHSFNNSLTPLETERRYFNQDLLSGV